MGGSHFTFGRKSLSLGFFALIKMYYLGGKQQQKAGKRTKHFVRWYSSRAL